ncbi:MAG: alpha/beta fold hydrolase [Pyrinomonadaceae bacterium]
MKKRYLAASVATGAIGCLIAWKFLTRASEVNWENVSGEVQHSENSHFVEVDGATVHYQEFGDAAHPTLILIHGYTASTYVWHTVAPMLADENFHVIAVDLLGFGFSEKPAWFEYSIVSQTRMIERFMDRLGIGRATLVGNSYGGAVASTLALDYPERVEKLVLVDAVINDEIKNRPILKLASVAGVGKIIAPFLLDSKRFLRYRMKGTLAPQNHHLITQERVDSIHRPLSAADAHHSVLSSARNWDACRIEEDAYLINHPTLIIWGEEDKIIPLHNGEKLNREILNSRLVVLNDCGHVPQEEKPERFVELVSEFCRDKKSRVNR